MTAITDESEQLDAAWITDALSGSAVAGGATVTDVAFDGWIGTGQTGRNARFRVTWDDPRGRPATVVGKFPAGDERVRASAFASGSYLKEHRFYDRVATTVDVRTPECYAARFDPDAQDFVLLMEDLSASEQGDQLDGLDADRLSLAVEQLVGLHAPRHGEEGLETFLGDDLPAVTPDQAAMMAQMMYQGTLAGFLERLGDRLDPDVAQLAEDFGALVAPWVLAGADRPATIVHLDYRADNLLFGTTTDAPPLVVVDWQTCSAGLGASDLAYVISGSFPDAADRAAVERDLVEDYRTRMAAAGHETTPDDQWRDYRLGSLWGMIITVIATVEAVETERGNDMLTAMAQRHGRQALDLDALSLLR